MVHYLVGYSCAFVFLYNFVVHEFVGIIKIEKANFRLLRIMRILEKNDDKNSKKFKRRGQI